MQGRIADLIRESPTALEKKDILLCDSLLTIIGEGLNQSQVRSDIGYTFLSGLRSALRQDPDVIMV